MAKVILAVGGVASGLVGFWLWQGMAQEVHPRAGGWMKILDGTGEGNLQIVGSWDDREAIQRIVATAPLGAWKFVREYDDLRVHRRELALPVAGGTLSHLRWEVRRDDQILEFGYPPAWRFWGLVGLIAAAPTLLAALAAGVVALASRHK